MRAFEKYHPAVSAFYFFSVIIIAVFVWHPIIQLSALLGGIAFCAVLQRPREFFKSVGFYIPLFLMVAVTNPLFSHNGVTPLFFLNGNPVTLEAFAYGVAIAVAVIGVMLWCKSMGTVMSTDKFLWLFARPFPKISLVLSAALRFIPLFIKDCREVGKAQKAMGLYSSKSRVDKIKSAFAVMSVMITRALESAVESSMSMKARGYGSGRRTSFSIFRFTARDFVFLCAAISLFTISLAGIALGKTEFYYYPEITKMQADAGFVITCAAYFALAMLPFITEVRQSLQIRVCLRRTLNGNITY